MSVIKCPKCGTPLSDDCVFVWKCNECGKAVKLNLAKLYKVQELKKQNAGKHLLKCSACRSSLDDGNEKIVCKCSSCGNVMGGNLGYFADENNDTDNIEKANDNNQEVDLIECPECGKKILKDSKICSYCGHVMNSLIQSKRTIPKKKIAIYGCIVLACIIIGILFKNIFLKLPDAEEFVYKQAQEIKRNEDGEDFQLEAVYCYRLFDQSAEIGDRRRKLVIIYSVLGTNGERANNLIEYTWEQRDNNDEPSYITNYAVPKRSAVDTEFKFVSLEILKNDIKTAYTTKEQIALDEWIDYEIGYVPIDIDMINKKLK